MRGQLDRVLELAVLLNDDMERDLARRGLTGSRAHLVWELNRHGPSTQQALAEALGVTPRAVTGLVDALADAGFVTREPHPGDRRATLVTFTNTQRSIEPIPARPSRTRAGLSASCRSASLSP